MKHCPTATTIVNATTVATGTITIRTTYIDMN